jgi:hypothetical protein
MAERINVGGAEAERIEDTGPALPRVDAAEFAAGLGAEPCGDRLPPRLSLLSRADLGSAVLHMHDEQRASPRGFQQPRRRG